MYSFPSELITIICSYIDSYFDLDSYEHIFESRIDWTNLIVLNYPQFYHVNVNKHNVKYIYLDLISYNSDWNNFIPAHKDTFKYLLLNNLLDSFYDLPLKFIFRYDDVEIYDLISHKELTNHHITQCISNNSCNILRHIMLEFPSVTLYNKLLTALDNDHYSIIKMNTVKIVIQGINFKNLDEINYLNILSLKKSQTVIFEYLLGLLPSNITDITSFNGKLKFILIHGSVYSNYLIAFYNKYNIIFDKEFVLEFIEVLNNNKFLYDGSKSSYDIQVIKFFKDIIETRFTPIDII